MKKIFFCLILLLITSKNIFAQEQLFNLKYNPTLYNAHKANALQKSAQTDYTYVCYPQQAVQVQINSYTEADESFFNFDGSLTVSIQNATPPFVYTLNSPLNTLFGGVLDSTSNVVFEPNFTFTGLEAAPYFITITDANDIQYTLHFELNNVGTIPLFANNFVYKKAFCNNLGRISKTFDTQQRTYEIYDVDGNSYGNLNNIVFKDLLPNVYYIRAYSDLNPNSNAYLIFEIERQATIELPFTDDFSTTNNYPNPLYWQNNQVFVNQTHAYHPLSIGVATFDGFNEIGQPYLPISENQGYTNGYADTLLSLPLCLGNYIPADSLYMSFAFQPKGLADYPNAGDSIFLELKAANDSWALLWAKDGIGSQATGIEFKQVIFAIPDSLIYDGMQFRFRNKATVSGANDHWHIDYVKIAPNRNINDTIYRDVAIATPPSSMLRYYRNMPWKQFVDFQDKELNKTITYDIHNNYNEPINISQSFRTTNYCTGTIIESPAPIQQNLAAWQTNTATLQRQNTFEPALAPANDSLIIENKIFIIPPTDDNLADNDTVYQYHEFFNYFAYDDGTAEKAYGLFGSNAALAYRFHINQPDTLQAVQISFVNMNANVTQNEFRLVVWSSITPLTNNDDTLYTKKLTDMPHYLNTRNGFYTYLLDRKLIVKDTIYIGLIQEGQNTLNIGFDVNNPVPNEILYNTSGTWLPTIFEGALMLRPLVGKPLPESVNWQVGTPPIANKPTLLQISVYPNPAQNQLFVQLNTTQTEVWDELHTAQIIDFSGKIISLQNIRNEKSIDVKNLLQGIYILRIFNAKNEPIYTAKFVKG